MTSRTLLEAGKWGPVVCRIGTTEWWKEERPDMWAWELPEKMGADHDHRRVSLSNRRLLKF